MHCEIELVRVLLAPVRRSFCRATWGHPWPLELSMDCEIELVRMLLAPVRRSLWRATGVQPLLLWHMLRCLPLLLAPLGC